MWIKQIKLYSVTFLVLTLLIYQSQAIGKLPKKKKEVNITDG